MYTLKEIAALRQKCKQLRLRGAWRLDRYSNEELQVICNGIGPEGFPKGIRKFVTSIHPTLEPAGMIHDVEFEESDGMQASFTAANDRYAENGSICAEAAYSWYNPLRYIVKLQAVRHAKTCQLCGWEHYREIGGNNVQSQQ